MIRGILSMYSWRYPSIIVYMLQSTEYQVMPYLNWFWHTNNFNTVAKRRELNRTTFARMLLLALRLWMLIQIAAGIGLIVNPHLREFGGIYFGAALIVGYPLVWAHLVIVPLLLGRWFIAKPKQAQLIRASETTFSKHKGAKLAIAGSYGKTTMKELLLTVLQEGTKVAATPANKNVAISHAYFAYKLQGDENVLVIEYGEGAPGDVSRFAKITHPTHAIITGIAPAHLDQYKTIERAAQDIFSIAQFVPADKLYVNAESPLAAPYIKTEYQSYTHNSVLGWKISGIRINLDGTAFTMSKGSKHLELHSGLLGQHQVGPLALVAALALDEFGLSEAQVVAGMAKTKPFEHRMQPYNLHGAWIIDDAYNGNIEGIKVGTQLLKALPGKRKIYVTPGLVDQGNENEKVHHEMGRLIAAANPDIVVLMQNSVTAFIEAGLQEAGYSGKLTIESDPLHFYNNMNLFVANGDLLLMQNDWTDNYA